MKKSSLTTGFILLFIFSFTQSCSTSKKSKPSETGQTADNLERLGKAFLLTAVSDDATYGYTEKNPIKVGTEKGEVKASGEYLFMNALTGPNGEDITFRRLGSCCSFKSPHGFLGSGLLDRFEVKYEGLKEPIILYLNMYDPGVVKAPKGFGFRK